MKNEKIIIGGIDMIAEKVREDTIKLLRECDAGAKMAVKSIDEVLDEVESPKLKKILTDSKEEHDRLKSELKELLSKSATDGKDPSPVAVAMSWTKINVKMMADKSDNTIAELMSEGCSMGIRSLCKYRNEYDDVEKEISDITSRLIDLETDLVLKLREFL